MRLSSRPMREQFLPETPIRINRHMQRQVRSLVLTARRRVLGDGRAAPFRRARARRRRGRVRPRGAPQREPGAHGGSGRGRPGLRCRCRRALACRPARRAPASRVARLALRRGDGVVGARHGRLLDAHRLSAHLGRRRRLRRVGPWLVGRRARAISAACGARTRRSCARERRCLARDGAAGSRRGRLSARARPEHRSAGRRRSRARERPWRCSPERRAGLSRGGARTAEPVDHRPRDRRPGPARRRARAWCRDRPRRRDGGSPGGPRGACSGRLRVAGDPAAPQDR